MANRRPVVRFKLLHNDREAIVLYYAGSEWEGWRKACGRAEIETARMFAVAATRWKLFAASGIQMHQAVLRPDIVRQHHYPS